MARVDFAGRVIIIGSGSIGQGMLPPIGRQLPIEGEGRLVVLSADEPYLGKLKGAFTDWTPLQGRGELFPEKLDVDSP